MSRGGVWIALIALLCTPALPALAIDREAFTFTSYDLDVRVEPAQQRLAVRGTVALRNNSNTPQKNVVLQISSSLTWRSIRSGDQPLQFVAQPFESDIDHTGELSEAIVSLPNEVSPGGTIELNIAYEGVIPLDANRLTRIGVPKETAVHSDWDQISPSFTAVRGAGNVVWYPVAMDVANLSEGNTLFEVLGRWKTRTAEASMRVHLCQLSPGDQRAIMNDPALPPAASSSSNQDAGGPCSNHEFHPLGITNPTFVLSSHQVLDKPNIHIAYSPAHQLNATAFAAAAEKVTPFVTEWFGPPKQTIRIVELPDPAASPFEAGLLLLTPLNDTDHQLLQVALVHELTHAAFPSPRPWISEGLAHFAQAVYREQLGGRQAAIDFLGLHRAAIVEAEQTAPGGKDAANATRALVSTSMEDFYRSKAAYVWWMLRDMLGDDVLKRALASYRAPDDIDPTYMQKLLQKTSGRDLQSFFDDWVYNDRGLADFRIASVFPRRTEGSSYVSTVTVENLGGAGAEVPVTVNFEGGEVTQMLAVPGRNKAVIRIETPKVPSDVEVNDGGIPESDLTNNTFKAPPPAQ